VDDPMLRGRLAALLLASVTLLGGCVHGRVRLGASVPLETQAGSFVLEHVPEDRSGAELVRCAVVAAAPQLARWGRLSEPVVVKVMPTHDSLESAVDRDDHEWLRAWARREVVFVQSPTTWFAEGSGTQPQVDELLLHELTHCLMYQAAARGDEWRRKGIPVWFREGMASVTANQGYRRGSLAALSRHLAEPYGPELLHASAPLMREQSEAVYTAAHHAFAFLVRRYGDAAVLGTLAAMRAGAGFDEAFSVTVGLAPEAFERDFVRFVQMEGWRRPWRPKGP
jgi:hypothetical protein